MMKLAATSFFVCGIGTGLASSIWMFVVFHAIGGVGIGSRVGCGSGIHRRNLAAAFPRPAWLTAAAWHRVRHFRVPGVDLGAISHRGRFQQAALAGSGRVALDLPQRGDPGAGVFRTDFHHSESPRYLVARQQISQARQVLSNCSVTRDVELTINRIADSLGAGKATSRGAICVSRPEGCTASSGWAWDWPSFSSSSVST